MSLNKLIIGTAQFGTNYGIANEQGKINKTQQKAILDFAHNIGIDTLDTAIDYGDSEINLGNYGVSNFKLITKIPPIPKNLNNVSEWISENVKNSLKRLGLRSIYGFVGLIPPFSVHDRSDTDQKLPSGESDDNLIL